MFYTPRFITSIFSIIRFPEINLPPNDTLLLCLAGDIGGKTVGRIFPEKFSLEREKHRKEEDLISHISIAYQVRTRFWVASFPSIKDLSVVVFSRNSLRSLTGSNPYP
ncbi:LOW QUALITY PROTEIN: hypothetical protein YC2023_098772 [Brassica napus]